MKRARTVAKNTLARSISQVFCMLLSAGFLMYATRMLGSADFGKYTFALSFAQILVVVSEMGISTILTKKIAHKKGDPSLILGNVLFLKMLLSSLFFILLFVAVRLLNYTGEIAYIVYFMGIFFIAATVFDLINAVFRGFEKMEYEAALMLLNRAMIVGAGSLILYVGGDLKDFVIAMVIANILSLSPGIVISARKFIKPKMILDPILMRNILTESLPVGVMLILTTLTLKSGVVLLAFFNNYSAVGWYGAPLKFIESMLVFPAFFAAALLPVFAALYHSSDASLTLWYRSSLRFLVIVGLPVSVIVTCLADSIVLLLFGQDYSKSVIVLQYLIWASCFNVISVVLSHLLIAMNKQKLNILSYGVVAVITILMGVVLIPQYSYTGAALSLLIGQILLFALTFYLVQKYYVKISLLQITIKPILSCILMIILIYSTQRFNIMLAALLGILTYISSLFIMKEFSYRDIAVLKEMINIR